MTKPTLDDLLASARGDEPTQDELARLDRKVAPLFTGPPGGGGGGSGGGSGAAGGGAAGTAAKSAVALKWLAGALAITVGGGIALRSALTTDATVPAPVIAPVPPPAAPPPPPTTAPAPEPAPPPIVKSPPRPQPAASSLVEESKLLDRAQSALHAGDAATALELSERHSRLFANGELREERERIAIEALVGLGRHDAAVARAKRFDRAFPNSVQSERIHALLDHR